MTHTAEEHWKTKAIKFFVTTNKLYVSLPLSSSETAKADFIMSDFELWLTFNIGSKCRQMKSKRHESSTSDWLLISKIVQSKSRNCSWDRIFQQNICCSSVQDCCDCSSLHLGVYNLPGSNKSYKMSFFTRLGNVF